MIRARAVPEGKTQGKLQMRLAPADMGLPRYVNQSVGRVGTSKTIDACMQGEGPPYGVFDEAKSRLHTQLMYRTNDRSKMS